MHKPDVHISHTNFFTALCLKSRQCRTDRRAGYAHPRTEEMFAQSSAVESLFYSVLCCFTMERASKLKWDNSQLFLSVVSPYFS